MHDTAWELGQFFIKTYIDQNKSQNVVVADIGSGDVNGSLKKFMPENVTYYGLDFEGVPNVDIVLKNAYEYPFKDNSVDFVISSSCFEHSEFFWLSFKEVYRILKPQGVFYLNAPSNGNFHRHPTDSWRFYPDAGFSLIKWANHCGHERPAVLESFMAEPLEDIWRDYVGVFIKDENYASLYTQRIIDQYPYKYTNGCVLYEPSFRNFFQEYTK